MLDLVGLDHDDYAGSHELFDFRYEKWNKLKFDDWQDGPIDKFTFLDDMERFLSGGWKIVLGNQEVVWLHKFGRVGFIREVYKWQPYWEQHDMEKRQKEYNDLFHTVRKELYDDISTEEILSRYKTTLEHEGYVFEDQEEKEKQEKQEKQVEQGEPSGLSEEVPF